MSTSSLKQSSLYPDILFHFTEDLDTLFEILRIEFKVSYAREKIIGPTQTRELGVPMVSFCDLKLSELKDQLTKYGHYGIGLTKEWANRNGLNPVMYVSRHCELTDNFNNGVSGIYDHMNQLLDVKQIRTLDTSYLNILSTYRYLKNYEGPLYRKGKLISNNYRFADEREWRYVPRLENQNVTPFLAISSLRTKEHKKKKNAEIEAERLHFKPEDIRYLIIKNDGEITSLINHLKDVKGKFDLSIQERLASRILTTEQIEMDI